VKAFAGPARRGGWFDGAIVALLIAASLLVQVVLTARVRSPQPGEAVGIVFAPWVSAEAAMGRVAQAGARVVRFGALPFIVIAEPEHADFGARISSAGAILTLDPNAIAACLGGRRT